MCFNRDENSQALQCVHMSVGYEGQCARCDTKHAYIGETSRTAYTRIRQHMADYRSAAAANLPALPDDRVGDVRKRDVKSWMWEHSRDYHEGQLGDGGGIEDYSFKVSGRFRKCLNRQIDEGLRMTASELEGTVLLNSKNEFFTPKIVMPVFRQQ